MKVIQAPDLYIKQKGEITCFMAGGMGHTEWIDSFLSTLNYSNPENLVIFNPYNLHIESERNQITWEFDHLTECNIFSIYFDEYTDQPVSMYELGRMLQRSQIQKFFVSKGLDDELLPCVISVNKKAKQKSTIITQCELMGFEARIRDPKEHAEAVLKAYKEMK